MNFIPSKFVRLKSTYIRLRTCYIHVNRRGCCRATQNNYVSSVCLVRLVQNYEALRIARSYEIWQQQNAILQWRAPVSLKWNLFLSCQNSFASSFAYTLLFFVGIFSTCKLQTACIEARLLNQKQLTLLRKSCSGDYNEFRVSYSDVIACFTISVDRNRSYQIE